jgi:hypothetical protein
MEVIYHDLQKGLGHGVDTENLHFLAWFIGVPVVYLTLVLLFRSRNLWDFKTRGGSRASDIMAFEIVAGGCVAYLAAAGVIGTFGLFGFPNESRRLNSGAYPDFYLRSEFVENFLIYPMISYQVVTLLYIMCMSFASYTGFLFRAGILSFVCLSATCATRPWLVIIFSVP